MLRGRCFKVTGTQHVFFSMLRLPLGHDQLGFAIADLERFGLHMSSSGYVIVDAIRPIKGRIQKARCYFLVPIYILPHLDVRSPRLSDWGRQQARKIPSL